MTLRNTTAFWLLASILTALLFASAVPSPLYVVFQDEWGFSSITLTSVFAVYAIALLVALLVVGSISDHIGRRPTLVAALALEIVAMAAFAGAQDIGWLFAARTLQGIATGTAMGAISAALIDLQPANRPTLGALMGAVSPLSGLALGALAAGLLVDYGPDPTRFVFWILIGAFAVALVAVLRIPETVVPDGAWRASLRPQVAVPASMKSAFVAALPCLAASWALGGLILSLGASLTAGVLGEPSHLSGGLPIFVMAGLSALASIWLRDVAPRTTARGGLVALIVGVGVALVALAQGSNALFLLGGAIAGLGFGPAFAGVFRALSLRAPADERAALLSAVFVVSYLAFSVPAIIAGAAVSTLGLQDTAEIYGAALIGIAAVALVMSGNLDGPEPEPRPAPPLATPLSEGARD
ncbi:MAG TPA: MFS transporter [Solirubrobacteraceae bacterium]|nr:MFS transporter [Solirubrobacteraceae bacterium]